MKIICWLKGIWRSISSIQIWRGGFPIDGCDYVDIEEHKNCTVTISKCSVCGKIDISWIK
jgi:anaerobic ribonucleoside-triphosphate reductase